jgi:hypothetical protein
VNKFEALKIFQGWPPEHQRLCAEYWIETGEVEPTQVWTTADKIQTVGELVQRGVSMPSDQPKTVLTYPREAAKAAAVKPARNFMRYTRDELTEVDSHVSEGRGPSEVARIMDKKYPRQRTLDAWEKMANRIKKVGLQAMLDKSIDVEFK